MRNKFHGAITSHCIGKSGYDPLSQVGYTELKINSDTESEVPISDEDDNLRNAIRGNSKSENDFAVQCASENPSKVPSDDFISVKESSCFYETRPLLSDLCVQPDVSKDHHVKPLAFDGATADFVDELKWQEVHPKPNLYRLPELILLDEISESSNVLGISHEESVEDRLKFPPRQDVNSSGQFELISLNETLPLVEASSEKYVSGASDLGQEYIDNHEEVLKSLITPSVTSDTPDQVHNYPAFVKPRNTDVDDLCELAASCVEGESSDFVSELPITRESDTHDEEPILLLSLSKDPLDQGSDLSSNNITRGEHYHGYEVQVTSSSNEIQMLRKSASVESSLESLDFQNVSDIEGESVIDQLKRQVEYDRKCIKTLYKELEEERNASAVAANQAMAMITRLQEEKAALHMEALQYLRMMEEQAEYDVDALEKANDLLAEKEKEIQDMEAELELYKSDLPDEAIMEDLHEATFELNIKSKKVDCGVTPCQDDTSTPLKPMTHDDRLKGKSSPKSEDILLNSQVEECDSSMNGDLHLCNGSTAAKEDAAASDGDDSSLSKATKHCDCKGQEDSFGQREFNLVALENEISDLNDRLEALEADHNFLEYMHHSLHNGNEGLHFIQEVAHQLQELRKLGIRLRSQSAP